MHFVYPFYLMLYCVRWYNILNNLPPYIHTYLPTYLPTEIPTYLLACLPSFLHTYLAKHLPNFHTHIYNIIELN